MSVTRRVEIAGWFPLSISEAWDLLSNTNRLNRLTGFPLVHFSDTVDSRGEAFREAQIRVGKFVVARYREFPFEWTREKSYSVVRRFLTGPIETVVLGVEMEPKASGVRIRFFGEVSLRWAWLSPLVTLVMKKGARDVSSFCADYCTRKERAEIFSIPRATSPQATTAQWRAAEARLRNAAPGNAPLGERLTRLLREGNDDEVTRMRPFVIADEWKADRDETLHLFLKATRAGLLDLEWELMCPNCRVPKSTAKSLSTLETNAHCDLCGIDFEGDFDKNIELRFSVSAQVREASSAVYCIGSPSNTPHILSQARIEPGTTRALRPQALRAEELRLRVLGTNESESLAPTGKSASLKFQFMNERWASDHRAFAPGLCTIEVTNSATRPLVVALERVHWDDTAVTAAYVTSLQEFRSSFGSEVLGAGRQVSIRTLTVLFSDLKDSTALYEQVGDAPAFGRVQQHFEFMFQRIDKNRGAVVKTMGDAVMATFASPADAVRAALEMQAGIEAFCLDRAIHPPLVLKLGIHNGPAVALNADGKLDYFGRTINIAARTQAQSRGRDIVVSEAILNFSEARELLAASSLVAEPFLAKLKGIEGEVTLCRYFARTAETKQAA